MALVEMATQRDIAAEPNDVFDAIADYQDVHPRLLTEHFTEYEVRDGGDGEGTVLHVRFQATSRRVRELLLDITEPEDNTLVEKDRNSTLVTTWTVTPGDGDQGARVRVHTAWEGAGGIGGFFERRFAPRALTEIYDRILANLAREMEKDA
ncbi:SRPBCC family protein [Streptomyces hainanensis]|uniref:SRPBCC family protein n=1 Tax=Streptomyces hainanensis TaxID=402648 RepID=A0A4R4TPG7_9ACTN|nr:SRPBCC family protein [Streptomyces hainanensis]TDC78646.1 SRPBCC family protein [Streptomyces hainanensis]